MPYLTPDVIPSLTKCKRISIPDDPYIWGAVNGAMLALTYSYNWETFGAITREQMADAMWPFVDQFLLDEHCEEGLPEEGECTEYEPTAPFISYAPNDPYNTPDFIPIGYLVPPWYKNPLIPLPGVLPGDAMVNGLSIAVFGDLTGLIESGLPRLLIHLDGQGQLEIELVRVPQGGQALVMIDGNPTNAKIIDLDSVSLGALDWLDDIFNIVVTAQAKITDVIELELETPGEHVIEIIFLPKVDAATLIGFGGGLRRLSFCGVDIVGGEFPVPQFRIVNDCELEWRPNDISSWTPLVDLAGCVPDALPPTEIRVAECGLEQNIGGAGWTDVANSSFYPQDAACSAVGFWAQSAEAYVRLCLAEGTEVGSYRYIAASDRVELRATSKQLNIRYGAGNTRLMQFKSTGDVIIGSTVDPYPGTTFATVFIEGHDNAMHTLRVQGRAAQTVPTLSVVGNGIAGNVTQVTNATKGIVNSIDTDGRMTIRKELRFGDIRTTLQTHQPGAIKMFLIDPSTATWLARHIFEIGDYLGVNRTYMTAEVIGSATAIGVHGALAAVRQPVSGDWQGNEAGKNLAAALHTIGWITDTTVLGTVPEIPEPVFLDHILIDEFCVIQQHYSDETVVASTNLNLLECLNDPFDPQAPEVLEAQRCRIAVGAVNYLVQEMYREAIDALLNIAPPGVDDAIRDRLMFQQDTGQEFADWYNDMFLFYAGDGEAIEEHFGLVAAEVAALAQLYYCSLDACGTMTPNGIAEFLLAIENDTALNATDAGFFATFVLNFNLASWAIINSHGYFYDCTECALEPCVDEGVWQMGWNFPTNSGTTEWDVVNGHYTSFTGWVHDSSLSTMTMTFERWVTDICVSAVCNTADSMTVNVYRLTDDLLLDSVAGISDGTPMELAYHAATSGDEAPTGIRIEVSTIDNGGEDNFSNAHVVTCHMDGRGVSPNGGDPLATCD